MGFRSEGGSSVASWCSSGIARFQGLGAQEPDGGIGAESVPLIPRYSILRFDLTYHSALRCDDSLEVRQALPAPTAVDRDEAGEHGWGQTWRMNRASVRRLPRKFAQSNAAWVVSLETLVPPPQGFCWKGR